MDTYTTIYRHLLWPLWETARGRPTRARLAYLERSQFRPPEELEALQIGKLRRLLVHAATRSPFYRRRFGAAGFDPARLRSLDDLERLPLLSSEEAQRSQAEMVVPGIRLLEKSTSGTTGQPFRFCYSLDSEVWRQATKLRAYGWAGAVPGARTVHFWGPAAVPPDRKKALKIALDRALRRELYLDCARQGEADLRAAVDALRRLRPACLVGFTQATVQLGRFILRHGLRSWPPMRVICGAERLFPQDRPVLEAAFGAPGSVFETYGCREFMLIASECEAHQGLHLSMENLVVEIVDERGRRLPDGEVGQVVVTDLHNLGMPLIRYVTSDLAAAMPSSARCACGRGLRRLSHLEGRQQDLLRGRDGRGIPGLVFNAVIAGLGGKVDQFQAVQRRDGRIDLLLVPGPDYDERVVEGLRHRLAPYLGDLPLHVDVVGAIPPLPSGKRRHVVIEP